MTTELVTSKSDDAANKRPLSPKRAPKTLEILVVEDNASTQAVVARMLQRLGQHVRVVGSVKDAKEALREAHFDAMLCDLGLPDGSGIDVMEAARELQPRLYSVALSGYGTDEDLHRTRQAGFVQHLVKPIRLAQLQEFVTTACAQL